MISRNIYIQFSVLLFIVAAIYFPIYSTIPFWDDIPTAIIPLIQSGSDYVSGIPDRLFFRPLEYYVNLFGWSLDPVNLWPSRLFSVLLILFTGIAIALLFSQLAGATRPYSMLGAAVYLLHPLNVSGVVQIDTISQLAANFASVASVLLIVRAAKTEITVGVVAGLLFFSIIGLAAKESYAATLVGQILILAIGFVVHRRKSGLVLTLMACLLLVCYLYVRASFVNLQIIDETARYQLSIDTNILKNVITYLAGILYLGSSPDAYLSVGWIEVFSVLVSIAFWVCFTSVIVTRTDTMQKTIIILSFGASFGPSLLSQGVSEHNASQILPFFLLALPVFLRPRTLLAAVFCNTTIFRNTIIAAGLALATLSTAHKVDLSHQTSMQVEALRNRILSTHGGSRREITCFAPTARRYSIYYVSDDILLASLVTYLKRQGLLQEEVEVVCANPVQRRR